ncbi:hypothetical protein BD410DRAFT_806696 [Rickenella mellea]|uniref:Uncharacterized protein n=1 Tax=Rickenella mellea TaxID=50990 RepID=A0A4Y7PSY4_9AGAM|nr:hypothetical protein BD410DRAFT_806696 [Rickenella mellea]
MESICDPIDICKVSFGVTNRQGTLYIQRCMCDTLTDGDLRHWRKPRSQFALLAKPWKNAKKLLQNFDQNGQWRNMPIYLHHSTPKFDNIASMSSVAREKLPSAPTETCEDSVLYPPVDNGKGISTLDKPADSNIFKPKATYQSANILSTVVEIFQIGFFPTVAIAYISFCFAVHYRNIYISTSSPSQLAIIKSATTSLAIIVIAIGLIPLKTLLSSLQSEEFFRTLKEQPGGVPVALINDASSSARGTLDTLKAVRYRAGSSFLVWSLLSSVLVIAISTLAPAALSVEPADVEGDIMGFLVGGVTFESVHDTSSFLGESDAMPSVIQEAAGIVWTEYILGINYSFQYAAMNTLVPFPLDLNVTTPSRWISDVVFVNPSCNWLAPTSMQNATDSTSIFPKLSGILPGTDVRVFLTQGTDQTPDAPDGKKFGILTAGTSGVINATTGLELTDGSSVFQFIQCKNCTRYQTLLGSKALGAFTGPNSPAVVSALGQSSMSSFLLGPNVVKNLTSYTIGADPIILSPRPIASLTSDYGSLLQSLTKAALNGALASSFVPGRTTTRVAHFTIIMPYVIVSTISMLLLVLFGIWCQLRSKVAPFTFIDIAYAVAGSDISRDSIVGDPGKPDRRVLAIERLRDTVLSNVACLLFRLKIKVRHSRSQAVAPTGGDSVNRRA